MGPQELEFEIHISYIVESIHLNSNVSLNCNFNSSGARIRTGFNSLGKERNSAHMFFFPAGQYLNSIDPSNDKGEASGSPAE